MHKTIKLKNGLQILTAPMKGAKTITILVAVGTGSKYENRANNGISHFLEHMFFKGTKHYPTPMALSSALDVTGAEYNAFTSKEYTCYYVKVDSSKTERAMELLSEMLVRSKFASAEFERERGVIIEEINMYEDNPMMFIEDVFEQCLYGDTPAGWDTIGSKENIKNITRADLLGYSSSQYQSKNTIFCLAGDLRKDVEKQVAKYFGDYAKANSSKKFIEKEKVEVMQSESRLKIKFKQTDQAHISLGVPAYATGDKRETALKILSVILGGSMSSRLFSELREKKGLAYYVHTSAECYTDGGYLTSQAGVPVNRVEDAIKLILAEYKKLSRVLVSKTELQRVKDMLNGKLILKLESSDDIANWYSRQAILSLTQERETGKGKKVVEPKAFLEAINKVTSEEIRNVAREIFKTEKLNLAIIGPYKEDKKFRELLKV
jgi:predicted Zn-dependent peptidase